MLQMWKYNMKRLKFRSNYIKTQLEKKLENVILCQGPTVPSWNHI